MAFELLPSDPQGAEVPYEDTMEGQLVEVFGLSGRVPYTHKLVAGSTFAHMEVAETSLADQADYPEGIDANGMLGRCLAWNDDEQKYIVEAFEGFVFSVPQENLREYDPPEPEDGGFDVAWPGGDWGYDLFIGSVAEALARKGHCMVQLFGLGKDFREEALGFARSREDFRVLEEELQAAYLGQGPAGGRVAQLAAAPSGCLEHCDHIFTTIGQLLEPVAVEALDFECTGRSSTLIRVPKEGTEAPMSITSTDVEEGVVEGLLHFLKRRKVSMLCVVADEGGEVQLSPREGLGWTVSKIPIVPNKLLLFRHDQMTYSYEPRGDSLALQSWLYSPALTLCYNHVEGGDDPEEQRLVIGACGPKQPTAECPHVKAIAVRLSGNANSAEEEWNMVCSGTDGLVAWPRTRWDQEDYYEPDEQTALAIGKSYSNHGAFVNDHHLIEWDNNFFGYKDEVKAMTVGVEQRLMLEVGYECLRSAGRKRADLKGSDLGMITATYASNWLDVIPHIRNEHSWTGWTSMQTAACVAQFVGSKGPIMRVDTACSSSLVATCTADHDLRVRRKDSANLVCAVMGQMDPFGWGGLCQMGMLSKKGRCFTFDHASDGFAKGEGCGAVYLQFEGSKEERWATLAGSSINQDGRSASMTAPNGPSQREMTRSCFDVARITPADLSVSECHGTGTALGDPIEVGALRAAMDGFRGDTNPILLTTVKCNLAHMEANAGISGVIKVTSMLRHQGVPMCIHVKSLNPHLDMEGFPWYIITELVDPNRTDMYIGVQGFGMGGTNARADFWGRTSEGYRDPNHKPPQQYRADFSNVPCPRCLGPMCWLCGVAVPKYGREHKRHHCSLIREGPAAYEKAYDFCSACYAGKYLCGEMVEEIPSLYDVQTRNIKLYAVGTWSAYSTYHELVEESPGVFTFAVELGETQAEMFHFVLNREPSMAYYPIAHNAGESMRVLGPDDEQGGRHWLIDGKQTGSPAGTLFIVTLTWDSDTGVKKVKWEVAPDEDEFPSKIAASDYANEYFALGSWDNFKGLKMRPSRSEAGLYEASFKMGFTRQEEFQFLRDNDRQQAIHPDMPKCHKTSLPVKGPDDSGEGRNWLITAEVGEEVRLQLRVQAGDISLTVKCESLGVLEWKSAEDRHYYLVNGSFNDWSYGLMVPDESSVGVYHYTVNLDTYNPHEFQIVVDGCASKRMYPASNNATSGGGLLMGPGPEGKDKKWLMYGWPGATFEIELDLNQEDRRKMVQWRPVDENAIADE
mmetsp:Transcript_109087/g.352132  ORF Transcript_109087/g.352132 Transcript_109087/m.352132 type:complete len:1251 (+) Transcript_109087:144-3896(+)